MIYETVDERVNFFYFINDVFAEGFHLDNLEKRGVRVVDLNQPLGG